MEREGEACILRSVCLLKTKFRQPSSLKKKKKTSQLHKAFCIVCCVQMSLSGFCLISVALLCLFSRFVYFRSCLMLLTMLWPSRLPGLKTSLYFLLGRSFLRGVFLQWTKNPLQETLLLVSRKLSLITFSMLLIISVNPGDSCSVETIKFQSIERKIHYIEQGKWKCDLEKNLSIELGRGPAVSVCLC